MSLAYAVSTHSDQRAVSPLMLSDKLITLARDCDDQGYRRVASDLVGLACAVLDRKPRYGRAASQRAKPPRSMARSG